MYIMSSEPLNTVTAIPAATQCVCAVGYHYSNVTVTARRLMYHKSTQPEPPSHRLRQEQLPGTRCLCCIRPGHSSGDSDVYTNLMP